MKYPKAGDLQKKTAITITGNPTGNPFEVHSSSGLEDSFARREDADHFADELRRSGAAGVRVSSRTRRPPGAPPQYHAPQGRPPGVPNSSLDDRVWVRDGSSRRQGRVVNVRGGWVDVLVDGRKHSKTYASKDVDLIAKNPEEQHDTEILEAMARTLWITAWADWVEELDRAERKRLKIPSFSGKNIEDLAPPEPPQALLAAQDLYILIERSAGKTPGELFQKACQVDGCPWNDDNADLFGHYLAMQSIGSGVSWFDDHKEFPMRLPGFECHLLDGEELFWSPQVHNGGTT